MGLRLARPVLLGGLIVGSVLLGGAAFSAPPDFDVLKYWSSSSAPYITPVSSNPETYIKLDLNQLNAVTSGGQWQQGGYYIHGGGVSTKVGNFGTGSVPLGTQGILDMAVQLKYYDANGDPPGSAGGAWSLKAKVGTSWVGLNWLDRGYWPSGHTQDFVIPQSVIDDVNAGASKLLTLGVFYTGYDCHVQLAGVRAYGVVPEPCSMVLMGLGVVGLLGGSVARRRRRG